MLHFKNRKSRFFPACAGLTMIELLVAMLLTVTIMAAVVGTMIQIMRISKTSEVELDAVANARAALETLSSEIKSINRVPGATLFQCENVPLAFGNNRDDDGDGRIDKEQPNALDDDQDWPTNSGNDQHAVIGSLRERPARVGLADWGDRGVDEDCVFHSDRLTFRLVPSALDAGYAYEIIRYQVGSFQGRDHVLIRRSDRFVTAAGPVQSTEAPLAYDILSFNIMNWNPNAAPANQYWRETWDSATPPAAPGFDLPAAVAIELIVYADPKGIAQYANGDSVETQTMRTVIAIENVIQDAAYPRSP